MQDRYLEAKTLALEALELAPAQRGAWLDERCAGDAELRAEVDWLVASARTGQDDTQPLAWPQPDIAPLIAGARIDAAQPGQYRIQRLLGEGGMGIVYLAERNDGDTHQLVALKLLAGSGPHRARLAQRMAEERRILASLQHPNIAHLLDGGVTADGQPFIALEYVEGERIDRWCQTRALSLRERVALFLKVCTAVEHAHQRLVIHRDLKPANILVTTEGEPKLLDFGIARLLEQHAPADPTGTAHRALTLAYASPEHIAGKPLTTATDVWSLGIVLYELLAGSRPHQAMESGHLLPDAIVSGEIQPPSHAPTTGNVDTDRHARTISHAVGRIPADIDAIVLKALRHAPEQRYPSVAAMADDLRCFLESRPVSARRGHALYRLRRFAWRKRWQLGAAAVLVAMLGGYLVDRDQKLRAVTAERNKAQALSTFMTDLFAKASPAESRGEQVTVKEVLDRGAADIRSRKDLPDDVRADLLQSMAKAYVGLHLQRAALPISEEALSIKRATRAPPLDVARMILQIATINANLGENAKAVASSREGLTLLSADNPDHFEVWAKLRVMELRSADLQGGIPPEKLIPELRTLLTALEAAKQEGLVMTRVSVMEALSNAMLRSNKPDDAVRMQERAVALAESHLQDVPASVLTTRSNLGSTLIETRNVKRGLEVMEAVDRDYVRLIGEATGARASLLNDISAGYAQLGDADRALEFAGKALEVARKALGTQNRFYLQMSVSQAISLSRASRHAEAEALLREAMPGLEARSAPGVDAVNHAYALAALSEMLIDTKGDAREALRLAAKAEDVVLPHASGNFLIVYRNAIRATVLAAVRMNDKPAASAAVARFAAQLDRLGMPADSHWHASTKELQALITP